MSRTTWEAARRLLVVRLDNLGDVLMCTPAIAALKHGLPDAHGVLPTRHVTLLGSAAGCAVARHVPEIDATIEFAAPWVASGREAAFDPAFPRRLAAHRFDAAVVFTTYSQSALPAAMLCKLAGIPLVLAHVRENPYGLVSDWIPECEPAPSMRHEVERQLALVATIGARPSTRTIPTLSLEVEPADRLAVRDLLAGRGVGGRRRYVVLHPGASAPSRRWPAERFASLAATLCQRGAHAVIVTGSAEERPLAASIVAAARAVDTHARVENVAGLLSLGEMIALVDGATALVSNNSGPVHVAAARGTPVVDLYALTNPQHTPWAVPHRVLYDDVPCKYCYRSVCPEGHHRCLTGVGVDRVVQALDELIDAPRGAAAASQPLPQAQPRSLPTC